MGTGADILGEGLLVLVRLVPDREEDAEEDGVDEEVEEEVVEAPAPTLVPSEADKEEASSSSTRLLSSISLV